MLKYTFNKVFITLIFENAVKFNGFYLMLFKLIFMALYAVLYKIDCMTCVFNIFFLFSVLNKMYILFLIFLLYYL